MRNAKKLQTKSKTHEVSHLYGDTYCVISGSSKNEYQVTVNGQGATCTCTWSQYRPRNDQRCGCSHTVAVFQFIENQRQRAVSAWADEDQATRQRRPKIYIGDNVYLTSRKVA
ncbi:MAG TPA: SWIM zinc finger family protein [Anaerolineae bacterium]|nr:SWIM zinc finger family protein [Anaerolineae bacterium]